MSRYKTGKVCAAKKLAFQRFRQHHLGLINRVRAKNGESLARARQPVSKQNHCVSRQEVSLNFFPHRQVNLEWPTENKDSKVQRIEPFFYGY